jgi:hypothetical protein
MQRILCSFTLLSFRFYMIYDVPDHLMFPSIDLSSLLFLSSSFKRQANLLSPVELYVLNQRLAVSYLNLL